MNCLFSGETCRRRLAAVRRVLGTNPFTSQIDAVRRSVGQNYIDFTPFAFLEHLTLWPVVGMHYLTKAAVPSIEAKVLCLHEGCLLAGLMTSPQSPATFLSRRSRCHKTALTSPAEACAWASVSQDIRCKTKGHCQGKRSWFLFRLDDVPDNMLF